VQTPATDSSTSVVQSSTLPATQNTCHNENLYLPVSVSVVVDTSLSAACRWRLSFARFSYLQRTTHVKITNHTFITDNKATSLNLPSSWLLCCGWSECSTAAAAAAAAAGVGDVRRSEMITSARSTSYNTQHIQRLPIRRRQNTTYIVCPPVYLRVPSLSLLRLLLKIQLFRQSYPDIVL